MSRLKVFIISLFGFISLSLAIPAATLAQGFQSDNFFQSIGTRINRFFLRVIPGQKDGQAVLQQTVLSLSELKTAQSNTEVDAVFVDQNNDQVGKFDLTINGPVQSSQIYNLDDLEQDSKITGDFSSGADNFSFDLDLKQQGLATYIRLNQLDDIGFIQTEDLLGKWLRFELSPQEVQPDESEDAEQDLSPEQLAEMEKITQDFISNIELSPAVKEDRQGESVFVINGTVSNESIGDYLLAMNDVMPQEEQVSSQEIESSLEGLSDIEFEVWVRTQDFYPTYVKSSFSFQPVAEEDNQGAMIPGTGMADFNQANLNIEADISDFNQAVETTVPTDYVDGQEAIMQALGLDQLFEGLDQFNIEGMDEMGEIPGEETDEMMDSFDGEVDIENLPFELPEGTQLPF